MEYQKINSFTSLFTSNAADPWLAADKLYHLLFCLFLTFFFSKLVSFTRYSFLRRYPVRIGSVLSLSADQFGFFSSAGASVRDAIADLLGVLIAAFALSFRKTPIRYDPDTGQTRRVLPVCVELEGLRLNFCLYRALGNRLYGLAQKPHPDMISCLF